MKFCYTSLKGWKYRTKDAYVIQTPFRPEKAISTPFIYLREDGQLIISGGYCWDGASGPAIDTKTFMRGSCVHDALYQLMRMGLLDQKHKPMADDLLKKLCLEDGMSKIRAGWVRVAVGSFVAKRACSVDLDADKEETVCI